MWGHTRVGAYRLAVLFAVCSCGNDLDDLFAVEDAGSVRDAAAAPVRSAGGFEFSEPACAECVTASCTNEAEACAGEPLCKAFWSCRAACDADDLRCLNRCRTQGWQWGGGAYFAPESGELEACLARRCSSCDAHHIVGAESCARCAATACSDVDWSAYSQSIGAQRLEACDASCVGPGLGDDVRLSACACEELPGVTPEAIAQQQARRQCVTATCVDECQGRPDLDCVGAVRWPPPVREPDALLRAIAWNFALGAPMPGLSVVACARTDTDCSSPLAGPTKTDDRGVAELTLGYRGTIYPFTDRIEFTSDGWRQIFEPVQRMIGSTTVYAGMSIKPDFESAFALAADVPVDPALGKLIVSAHDCTGMNLPGAVVTTEPPGHVVYFGSPDGTSTAEFGVAWAVNLPPGLLRITVTRDDRFIGYTDTQVVPGPEGYTFTPIAPTPPPSGE